MPCIHSSSVRSGQREDIGLTTLGLSIDQGRPLEDVVALLVAAQSCRRVCLARCTTPADAILIFSKNTRVINSILCLVVKSTRPRTNKCGNLSCPFSILATGIVRSSSKRQSRTKYDPKAKKSDVRTKNKQSGYYIEDPIAPTLCHQCASVRPTATTDFRDMSG